jgi:hypothetical protein
VWSAAEFQDFERLTRWLVRVDGFDYGPFTPDEVRERIRDGRVTLRSEISEERDGRWLLLEEVEPFRALCEQLIEEEKERARQSEMDKAETQVRRTHRVATSVSHFGVVGLLVAGGIVAWLLASSKSLQPSNYGADIFYETELGRIEPWARFTGERAHEWRFGPDAPVAADATAPRAARRARRASYGGGDGVYEDRTTDEVMSFDFGDEDAGGGRTLGDTELNAEVIPKAKRLLERCLIAEAGRRPGVAGGQFRFAVLPTGRISSARVMGAMSGKMHACTKSSLRSIQIAPFAGGARWIDISLRLSTVP